MPNDSFIQMLLLISSGARGTSPKIIPETDISAIHRLAHEQQIWPIVFLSIRRLVEAGFISVPAEQMQVWQLEVMSQVMRNTQREYFTARTVEALAQAGVTCCLLKGTVLAQNYHTPSCRISNDVDIYINQSREKTAERVLRGLGFEVIPRARIGNHNSARHPKWGLFEFHVALYDETMADLWFDQKKLLCESFRSITTEEGNTFTTLGITDGLIFTTLHLIKHFIHRGAGIRMVMDTLLYMTHYRKKIDWERFDRLMKQLKYDGCMSHMIGIGIQYLGFGADELPACQFDDALIEHMLVDIEEGGIYGKSEFLFHEYNHERFRAFRAGSYHQYMKKWRKEYLLEVISLNRDKLAYKYPYVKKSVLLVPVTWVHRAFDLGCDLVTGKKNAKRCLGVGGTPTDSLEKRMALIRALEMI